MPRLRLRTVGHATHAHPRIGLMIDVADALVVGGAVKAKKPVHPPPLGKIDPIAGRVGLGPRLSERAISARSSLIIQVSDCASSDEYHPRPSDFTGRLTQPTSRKKTRKNGFCYRTFDVTSARRRGINLAITCFRGPRIIAPERQVRRVYPRMIPLCSRFDSVLFTPKMPAIACHRNYSRSPVNGGLHQTQ